MKLPNGERALLKLEKFAEYCLYPSRPRGRHKARVFAAVGIRQADTGKLRTALLKAARDADAVPGPSSAYGRRYLVDFDMPCQGRTVKIRSAWIVAPGTDLPRWTTCYVL